MSENNQKTPDLYEIVSNIVESRLVDLHTSMPCEVVSYDDSTGYVSVQPSIKKKYIDKESPIDLPVIPNVPVAFYRTKNAFISMPIAKGDVGHIKFSERSLDIWKNQGGLVDPKDTRKHHLTDAVFYLGGYPNNDHFKGVDKKDIHIKNKSGEYIIKPNGDTTLKNDVGTFQLTNDGKIQIAGATGEIMDLLSQMLAKLQTHKHSSSTGPTGPMLPPELTDMATIQTSIDGMKV